MCGICGIASHHSPPDFELVKRINARLFHRGPDECGEWCDGQTALAMRRLAIIDLRSGQQPIFNEDGSVVIVFNGEIYNFPDLREQLEKTGHRFATHSDTETAVHTYEQYGPKGLAQLNGMFALAIWDRNQKQLLLARDRAGKKPLYYAEVGGQLAFSSELPSLLEYPGISRDVDEAALDNYFSLGYVPPPRTIFKSVRQLGPGEFLIWRDGQKRVARYWRLRPQESKFRSEHEAAEALLPLIKDAVRIRLHSDVPFGALLSGGVDSGLVVALMSQLMDRPVETFTIGFDDKALDESDFAAEVAKKYGTSHHQIVAQPHTAAELISKLVAHFGEPFADASAIPTYLVSEMARRHVTMALSGDGGDEVFGGYPSYRYHALAAAYREVPSPLRALARSITSGLNGAGGRTGKRVKRFLNEAELPVEQAWFHSRSLLSASDCADLYTPEFQFRLSATDRGATIRDSFAYFREFDRDSNILNDVDYETYLPGDILVKVDRMSMANSLEMRAPLLDYRIAEFAAGLPREWKWTASRGKKILKLAAAQFLPESALTRRKQGFVAPIGKWLAGELKPLALEVICRSRAGDTVRLDHCRRLFEAHARGEITGQERKLWTIFCYLLWHEQFAG
jgi:asparagine synthase (glutamine-hydrolysing)